MHDMLAPHPPELAPRGNDDRQQISLKGSLAGRKLVHAIEALDPLRRMILVWQLGLEGSAADATTIAGRLSLSVESVDRLIDEAVEELGWELLSSISSASNAEAAA
jgi:hypothetical protein